MNYFSLTGTRLVSRFFFTNNQDYNVQNSALSLGNCLLSYSDILIVPYIRAPTAPQSFMDIYDPNYGLYIQILQIESNNVLTDISSPIKLHSRNKLASYNYNVQLSLVSEPFVMTRKFIIFWEGTDLSGQYTWYWRKFVWPLSPLPTEPEVSTLHLNDASVLFYSAREAPLSSATTSQIKLAAAGMVLNTESEAKYHITGRIMNNNAQIELASSLFGGKCIIDLPHTWTSFTDIQIERYDLLSNGYVVFLTLQQSNDYGYLVYIFRNREDYSEPSDICEHVYSYDTLLSSLSLYEFIKTKLTVLSNNIVSLSWRANDFATSNTSPFNVMWFVPFFRNGDGNKLGFEVRAISLTNGVISIGGLDTGSLRQLEHFSLALPRKSGLPLSLSCVCLREK